MTSHLNSLIITRQTCTETQKDNREGQRFGSVWTNVPSHEWAVCSWFGVIKLFAGYVHQCFYMSKHQSLCRWRIWRRQPRNKDIVLLKAWVVRLITSISKYSKDLILPLLPSSTTCVAAIRIKMSLFVCLLCSTVNKIWVSMIYRSLTIFYLHFTHQPNIWRWGCAFSTYVFERLQWWSNKEDKLNTEVPLCVFLSKAVQ